MADRLSALDASLDSAAQVSSVSVLRRPRGGFDYGQLTALLDRRLPDRYRQKVMPVPGNLARPVWLDDPDFDLTYHVRRSALPRPGTEEQMLDLVARLISRPVDRDRPLWEVYLVEGLAKSHVAVVTKTHLAMADDLERLILAAAPAAPEPATGGWRPRQPRSRIRLLLDAARAPGDVIENARFVLGRLFPAMPLVRDQALAVGVTSYDGGVYFGLTGDRDAAVGVGPVRGSDITQSDVDLVAKMVEESVDELLTIPRKL